jgi:hypothetical protein
VRWSPLSVGLSRSGLKGSRDEKIPKRWRFPVIAATDVKRRDRALSRFWRDARDPAIYNPPHGERASRRPFELDFSTREETQMTIKSVVPMSCAKVAAVLYGIGGLLAGGLFSLVSLMGGLAADDGAAAGFGAMIGAGAIIVFPLVYACLGFVGSLIAAWLYNIVAGMVGGIEFETQ